jgi:parallel beta-helix repeat protein
VKHNHVSDTTLRGITMGEMSMGEISHNTVAGALGVGIYCVDSSECEIVHNTVLGTRIDPSGDVMRAGVAIESVYNAQATVHDNVVSASPGGIKAFGGTVVAR